LLCMTLASPALLAHGSIITGSIPPLDTTYTHPGGAPQKWARSAWISKRRGCRPRSSLFREFAPTDLIAHTSSPLRSQSSPDDLASSRSGQIIPAKGVKHTDRVVQTYPPTITTTESTVIAGVSVRRYVSSPLSREEIWNGCDWMPQSRVLESCTQRTTLN
jgi:hypothetical protein